jgi:signal recognition particle subunit SRP54
MIDAMTRDERDRPDLIDDSRRHRIAAGAGVSSSAVERFLGQFGQVRETMKWMARSSPWPGSRD